MRAAKWGFGVALAHRLLLGLWLALIWAVVGANLGSVQVDFHTAGAQLPALSSPADEYVFGVWRRWDAVHYLDLAANGYRVDHPGPTVFGVLTPLAFRLFAVALPLDLAAMVVETLAFGIALTLMYKVGEVYYGDADLGRWAVMVAALLPLAYLFDAPMSESIYLAATLGRILLRGAAAVDAGGDLRAAGDAGALAGGAAAADCRAAAAGAERL